MADSKPTSYIRKLYFFTIKLYFILYFIVWAVSLLSINLSADKLITKNKIFTLKILMWPVILPKYLYLVTHLYKFRGEPAITKLDKPFTTNHRLSQNFATFMCAILQFTLISIFDLSMIRSLSFGF